jgi:hypothetical protein
MNTLDNMDVKNVTVDGIEMIEITLGSETLMLTTTQARSVSEWIKNKVELSASLAHIDAVFDDWGSGDDGCTC